MSFKLPPSRPVVHTPMSVVTQTIAPMTMPTGIIQTLEGFMFGKKDTLHDLWLRYKNLPDFIGEKARATPHALTYKTAKLYVYDFLSDAAKEFKMTDIMNNPEEFFDINFPNYSNASEPLQIRLVAKSDRGNMLLSELEQLETTVELTDWHK